MLNSIPDAQFPTSSRQDPRAMNKDIDNNIYK